MKFTVKIESRPDLYDVRSIERTLVEECIESQEELMEFFKLVMQAATFVVRSDEHLELVREESFQEEPAEHVPMSEERYEEIRRSLAKPVFEENCDEDDCSICHPDVDESPGSYLQNAQMLFEEESAEVRKAFKKAKKGSKKKKSKKKKAK